MSKFIICSLLFFGSLNYIVPSDDDGLFDSVGSEASDLLSSLGQSVGIIPDSYVYSFRFFNDTPGPVLAAVQRETDFLGAEFAGDLNDWKRVDQFTDSGDYFTDLQLYIRVWLTANSDDVSSYANASTIGTFFPGLGNIGGGIAVTTEMKDGAFYYRDVLSLTEENDPLVYYYHAFTREGEAEGEYLGVKDVTSEFSGVFYNSLSESSDNDVSLTFNKNGTDFTVTLESNSFSLLESDSLVENSIRPSDGDERSFVFTQGDSTLATIPISSEGIANTSLNPETEEYELSGPATYTYEVWDSNGSPAIGMQGLYVGNFDVPLDRVRDINPLECSFWYESAEQAMQVSEGTETTTDYSSVSVDLSDSLWLTYKTNDQTVRQKIELGSVVDLSLLRPQLSEEKATLYCVFIESDNDDSAIEFLDRLDEGLIGADALYTEITTVTELVNMQSNENGIITDTDGSGLTGYVVLADRFYPRGLGSGPYYYSIPAASLEVGILANLLYFSDESYDASGSLQSTIMQEFAESVMQWIVDYKTDPTSVEESVTTFVTTYGNATLFDDSQQLTSYAQTMIQTFLTGVISIANPPIIRQAGTNWYSFTLGASLPTGWPESSSESN